MSDHVMGVRKEPGGGWAVGTVHARVRHGKAALELRRPRYVATLRAALEALGDPRVLNGHGGTSSSLLGGTAGLVESAGVLREILAHPGRALAAVHQATGITQREWARRSGVSVTTIGRVVRGSQAPTHRTVARLLEALQ
jgi:hypothetical protein